MIALFEFMLSRAKRMENVNWSVVAWIIDLLELVDFYYHRGEKKLFRLKLSINLPALYFFFFFPSLFYLIAESVAITQNINSSILFKYWWSTQQPTETIVQSHCSLLTMFLQFVIRFSSEGNWFLWFIVFVLFCLFFRRHSLGKTAPWKIDAALEIKEMWFQSFWHFSKVVFLLKVAVNGKLRN